MAFFFTVCKNLFISSCLINYLPIHLYSKDEWIFFMNVKNYEFFFFFTFFNQKFTPDHVHRTGQLRPHWIHLRWFLLRVRGQAVWPLKVTAWCQYQCISYDHHRIRTDSKCFLVPALHTYNQVSTISLTFLKSNCIFVVLMECHIFPECLWLLSSE